MDVESKKHIIDDDGDVGLHAKKKHIVEDLNGSPCVNGGDSVEQEEPGAEHFLEDFRKEALYRRMRYYSRECDHLYARLVALEQRKRTCETGLAVMAACWTQLIDTIMLLTEDSADLSVSTPSQIPGLPDDDDEQSEELAKVLRERLITTQHLATRLVQQTHVDLLRDKSFQERCSRQMDCTHLRSQVTVMRSELKDLKNERDQLTERVAIAENAVERLKSRTVQSMEAKKNNDDSDDLKQEAVVEDVKTKSSSPATPPACDTVPTIEYDVHVKMLRDANARLAKQVTDAEKRASFASAGLNVKEKQAEAQCLKECLAYANFQLKQKDDQIAALEKQRVDWPSTDTHKIKALESNIRDCQDIIDKKDKEILSLRASRTQAQTVTAEVKAKLDARISDVDLQALRDLVGAQRERIDTLLSEIKRLKTRLVSTVNDANVVDFVFFNTEQADIRGLSAAKREADSRITAFEHTLAGLDIVHPDASASLRREVDLRVELSHLKERLKAYEDVYGNTSLGSDVAQLSAKLEAKQTRIRTLEVQVAQSEIETSIYAETDKLAEMHDKLLRQCEDHASSLAAVERRLEKSYEERAMFDNRNNTKRNEISALRTILEGTRADRAKQATAITALQRYKENAEEYKNKMDRELSASKVALNALKRAEMALLEEMKMKSSTWDVEMSKLYKATSMQEETRQSLLKEREDLMKEKAVFELERTRFKEEARIQSITRASAGDGQELQDLMSVLKCSTCKLHFRDTLITKCRHTFCKDCVEARITTRQRKCPACNLAFSASDVMSFYFQ